MASSAQESMIEMGCSKDNDRNGLFQRQCYHCLLSKYPSKRRKRKRKRRVEDLNCLIA